MAPSSGRGHLIIRSQQAVDDAQVGELLTDAFADSGRAAKLARALRGRTDTQAQILAVDGDLAVGLVQLSISWVDAPRRLVEVLTLSPLGVATRYQSRGIGTRLLTAAAAAADDLGVPLLFLEGNPAYYAPRGWLPASEFGFGRPSTRIPEPGFQVLPLAGYDPSTMRGAVVYNDTFWSEDVVGLRPDT